MISILSTLFLFCSLHWFNLLLNLLAFKVGNSILLCFTFNEFMKLISWAQWVLVSTWFCLLFRSMLFNFQALWDFKDTCCCWFLGLLYGGHTVSFSNPLNVLRSAFWTSTRLPWQRLHVQGRVCSPWAPARHTADGAWAVYVHILSEVSSCCSRARSECWALQCPPQVSSSIQTCHA